MPLLGGLLLGFALGANDAANVFGTAVASKTMSFRTAAIICGLAVIAGAYLQGSAGIATYHALTPLDIRTALIVVCSVAVTIFYMSYRKLSVSSSQAIVGALVAIGLATDKIEWGVLLKVVGCWVATPLCAICLVIPIYYIVGTLLRVCPMSMLTRDKFLWLGLVVFGIYGAYALGANNVANATGAFSMQFDGISDRDLALYGGISIALGAMICGKRIMMAVGSDVMQLNSFTALISVMASSITIHLFALIGVPVSSNQALVGAIVGIGLLRNPLGLHFSYIKSLALGWIITPLAALILTAAGYTLFR